MKKNNKLQLEKYNKYLFYIAWIFMEIKICFANSSIGPIEMKYLSYFCMLLFFIKIINTKYNRRELIINIILFVLSMICTIVSKDSRVMWFTLAIIAMKNIEFKEIVKISFITMLTCVMVFLFMCLIGYSPKYVEDYSKGIRFTFGLGHPNMFSAYYVLLISHIVYLYYEKINFKWIIPSLIIEIFIFFLSKSTTGLIVYLYLLVSVIVFKQHTFKNDILKKMLILIVFISIIIFTLTPLFYNENITILSKIDSFITGRFSQANFYFNKYGISFFGNNITKDLVNPYIHAIMDIGYTRMLICNGIYYYIIVVASYIYSIIKVFKEKNYNLIIILLSMCIFMLTENVATYIFMNVSMLYFSIYIYGKEAIINEKKRKNT